MPKKIARTFVAIVAAFGFVGASEAGETVAALISAGMDAICAPFAAKVSGSEGNFRSKSKYNCLGAFQFCPGTFELYYNGTPDQFLSSPSDQVVAWTKYEQTQWALATKYKLVSLVGSQVCYSGKCGTIDNSAILMGCQFGCGNTGKLANYMRGQDCNARNVKDGNLVSVCSYLLRGKGYDVPCFTGEKEAARKPDAKPQEDMACQGASPGPVGGRMEIEIKNFKVRFDDKAPSDSVKRILEIIQALN